MLKGFKSVEQKNDKIQEEFDYAKIPGSWPRPKDGLLKFLQNMTKSTNKNNKKLLILKWENRELKDGAISCEKFRVIAGSEKENLLFYSTFFDRDIDILNRFKDKATFKLSTEGDFMEDVLGIIQGVGEDEDYELEEIRLYSLIKELWEEKESRIKKLEVLEQDLEEKKKFSDEINQDLLNERGKFFDLNAEFNKLQFEKRKVENERLSPQKWESLTEEIENLKKNLKTERDNKEKLSEQLKKIHDQGWRETIEAKFQEKKDKQTQLKIIAGSKLSENIYLLETLLVMQEQFDSLVFQGVDQRFCLPIKKQLQQAKNKLEGKLSDDDIEKLCENQTEITKLTMQLEQWHKLVSLQDEIRGFVEVPTTPARN